MFDHGSYLRRKRRFKTDLTSTERYCSLKKRSSSIMEENLLKSIGRKNWDEKTVNSSDISKMNEENNNANVDEVEDDGNDEGIGDFYDDTVERISKSHTRLTTCETQQNSNIYQTVNNFDSVNTTVSTISTTVTNSVNATITATTTVTTSDTSYHPLLCLQRQVADQSDSLNKSSFKLKTSDDTIQPHQQQQQQQPQFHEHLNLPMKYKDEYSQSDRSYYTLDTNIVPSKPCGMLQRSNESFQTNE
ncbi:unnamed protein product, partial [Trichobilharzia regenti]